MRENNLYKADIYRYMTGTGRIRKRELNDMYMNMLCRIAAAEHEYKTPDFNSFFYEMSIMTGVAAFYKCKVQSSVNYGKWCCTPARPADVINNMLIADRITTAGSDYSLELEVEKDCILLFNNNSLYPSIMFAKYADDLTETAISASKLTKWARMTPIPRVDTDTDIAKYTTLLQRILEGEDINVLTDELSVLKDGHRTIDDNVLRLTDETSVDKLHFFDEHIEQILRRFATWRGLPFSTTAKSSQNLIDELHDMDAISTFMIEDEIKCRRDGFERAAAFMLKTEGEEFDFAYKPSDVLQRQLERTAIEYTTQLAEADRIESEASQKESQGIKFIAEAEKLEAEAEKLEAETEMTEVQTEEMEVSEETSNEKEGEENESEETPDTTGDDTVRDDA